MLILLNDQNFETEVLRSNLPVLVDFWAPWCGPCQIYEPIIEELAKDFKNKVKIGKLNVDENPTITEKYSIMSIPTSMLFNQGEMVKMWISVQAKEVLIEEIKKYAL